MFTALFCLFAMAIAQTRYRFACALGRPVWVRDTLAGKANNTFFAWSDVGMPGRKAYWYFSWAVHPAFVTLSWFCGGVTHRR